MTSIYGAGRLDRLATVRQISDHWKEWSNIRPTGTGQISIAGRSFAVREAMVAVRRNSKTAVIQPGTAIEIDGLVYDVRSVPSADITSGMVFLEVSEAEGALFHSQQIDAWGQTVTLRRSAAGAQHIEVSLRALVHGYTPDELVGGIQQGDTEVVLSPVGLIGSPFEADPPRRGDRVVIAGRPRFIESVDPVLIRDEIVRIEMQVKG